MSLVGTRPPTVDEWDKYELHHRARLATKPGLTGMWQVSGRSNITDLCKVEDAKLFECDICGRYYLKHDADLHFNKYEVKEWYVNTCKKEINEVNSLLEPIQQEYGIIFPIRSYEEGIFKNYPIILKSFNFTDEEMIQEFMINAMFFAESCLV